MPAVPEDVSASGARTFEVSGGGGRTRRGSKRGGITW